MSFKLDEILEIKDKELISKYLNKTKKVGKVLNLFLNQMENTQTNITLMRELGRFLNLLNVFSYGEVSKISIDTVSSGFPHFKEIKFLESSIPKQKPENDFKFLKEGIIRELFETEEYPIKTIKDYKSKKYLNKLYENRLNLFLSLNFTKQNILNLFNGRYFLHWSSYDSILNLPIIYILEVELLKDEIEIDEIELYKQLELVTSSNLTLNTIVKSINANQNLQFNVKKIQRTIIGPFFSNNFTKHNENISNILEEEEDGFICEMTNEYLYSTKTIEEKTGFLGMKKIKKEIYEIPDIKKGYSYMEKFIIFPYSVYQKLNFLKLDSAIIQNSKKVILTKDNKIIF